MFDRNTRLTKTSNYILLFWFYVRSVLLIYGTGTLVWQNSALDRTSILFIKFLFCCGRFAALQNWGIFTESPNQIKWFLQVSSKWNCDSFFLIIGLCKYQQIYLGLIFKRNLWKILIFTTLILTLVLISLANSCTWNCTQKFVYGNFVCLKVFELIPDLDMTANARVKKIVDRFFSDSQKSDLTWFHNKGSANSFY